jgi:hypothetical protein
LYGIDSVAINKEESFIAYGITDKTNLLVGMMISLASHFDTSYDDHRPVADNPAIAAIAHFEELKASVKV